MNKMRNLLEEIKSYPGNYLDNLIFDQTHKTKFINMHCVNCKNHDYLGYEGIQLHICDDNYSGLNPTIGKHVLYSETIDMCIECDGFDKK
jgi:hypothetical protein